MTDLRPGPVLLIGSGEAAPGGARLWRPLLAAFPAPVRVAILETPAGFQPNSEAVARRVARFLEEHLPNHRPQVVRVPARRRGTPLGPDNPEVLEPLKAAHVLVLGAGSPTYAVRHLLGTLAWALLRTAHALGAGLALASAAAIAVGAWTLPVYEIFKVGVDDLRWHPGLDLLGPYGLSLAIVSHWDNREGGAELDTRRGFVGVARFEALRRRLPPDAVVLGLDEHTGLLLDLGEGQARVLGRGTVTVLRGEEERTFERGTTFPLTELGPFHLPEPDEAGLDPALAAAVEAARAAADRAPEPPPEVLELVRARQAARARKDWATADRLREEIRRRGWIVMDTPEGPRVERADD